MWWTRPGSVATDYYGRDVARAEEIATALRLLLRTTHNLAEGAGAAGLAGLFKLREQLAGQRVAVVLSGGNVDESTLRRIVLEQV